MSRKIHIVLPTYNPEEFFNKFFKHLDAFKDIKEDVSFGIIFQTKYSQEDIMTVVDEFLKRDLLIYYDFKEYEGTMQRTPLIKIRDDAAMLNPDADYFLNVDDDIIYTCSSEYLRDVLFSSINFMEKNDVGSIMLGFPSHNDPFKEIRNDGKFHKLYGDVWCGQGLLLKNVYDGHIVPVDATRCVGGNDDVLMADCRKYINNIDCFYYGVAVGHHTDLKDSSDRSMNRLKFKEFDNIEGSCRRYINALRNGMKTGIVSEEETLNLYFGGDEIAKDKIIVISSKGKVGKYVLSFTNKNNLHINMSNVCGNAYSAIIDISDDFIKECVSKEISTCKYRFNDKQIQVISSGVCSVEISSIKICDKNISMNKNGLNFAVLSKKDFEVIDCFNVDTSNDNKLLIRRR